jgi:tyrosyl-tRNA synthetase
MIDLVLGRAKDVVVREDLERLLKTKSLRVKLGIDPTGPRLHLGRAATLHRLRNLQDMGHTIVLIIGDRTAEIGDASDKTSEREVLSAEQISINMSDYRQELGRILDMKKVELRYNSEWFDQLEVVEFARLAQHFTVAQMIERENFAARFKEQKPISLHEFLYPVLQGYDSVAVEADLEVGGTDQLFNMLAGRTMQKHYGQVPQQVITFDLLTGPDGRKMSTSWGNAIYIDGEPNDMYGRLMSITDELIAQYYRICTDVPEEAIEAAVKDIAAGANPRDTKASLAREIVGIYHGGEAALVAEEAFNRQFREGKRPEEIPTEKLAKARWEPVALLVHLKLAASNSEARRLLEQGGVRLNDHKIGDEPLELVSGDVLQAGKRRFVKLLVK